MKLAVIQHELQPTAEQDVYAVAGLASEACAQGAEVVVCPFNHSLADGRDVSSDVIRRSGCGSGTAFLPYSWPSPGHSLLLKPTPLGSCALLLGDECIDESVTAALSVAKPDAVVMRPGSESPLQAEAFIEWALAWSMSIAGLVIVCDTFGSSAGERTFGGSCVAAAGELVAEAGDGSELLVVEIEAPVVLPEPREPVPPLPMLLAQRWSFHRGERLAVDYPADVGRGRTTR